MSKHLESNLWKYAVLLIAEKRVFIAILGSYYLTIEGVTPKTVGVILLVAGVSGFLFEVPSGYASDKLGHKQALVASRIFAIGSTLCFIFAANITALLAAAILLSLSQAFQSGTGSVFMHETLRGLKRDHEYSEVMGKLSSISFAVPIIFTVLVPFFVQISYKIPFLVALIIDCIAFVASLLLVVPPVTTEHVEEIDSVNFKQVVKDGYRRKYFSLALISGIISGVLYAVGGFRAPYQSLIGVPVALFGVFFGLSRVFVSLMLAYSYLLGRYFDPASFYRAQIILHSILFFILGIFSDRWIVVTVFIVMNAFQWGLSKIDEGYQLSMIKTSKFKATLLSLTSQVDKLVSAVFSFGVGVIIEKTSYQQGFLCSGILFFIMTVPMYFYIARGHVLGVYKEAQGGK